ncbi:toprim domain-containing protein [Prunus dulcis]|uniref:Toprim domain-containing protein n=1 Tax=Prunus dulcis TaxID=3755 RepID=A0A4Y1RAI0_PRUDU|nr:toprim domain-containing protein [Prunus dulcis]
MTIVEKMEEQTIGVAKVDTLKQKMELLGILCNDSCVPGRYTNLLCPKVYIDGRAAHNEVKKIVQFSGQMTEESLRLEPPGEKITAYFSERMISDETLRRNAVMQRSGDKDIIAFTYKRNGLLVGCKFRSIEKRYWKAKGSENTLYGIDDINDAAEIIIVEGEIDKLSVEEAGFCNCVSVPDGAPGKSSNKLPPVEKVSRIILATDNDKPGQALARDIALRLGTHRCWQVRWPKKDESSYYKDANEVLRHMGPDALRKVIENAKPYYLCISDRVVSSDKHKPGRIPAS